MTADNTMDNATLRVNVVVHLNAIAVDGDTLAVNIQLDSGASTDVRPLSLDRSIVARTPVPSTGTSVS